MRLRTIEGWCTMTIASIPGLTSILDSVRLHINHALNDTRSELGQFMTAGSVANFMAGLFRTRRARLRILDPGAGIGTLTAALVERLLNQKRPPSEITATCYEIDARLFE